MTEPDAAAAPEPAGHGLLRTPTTHADGGSPTAWCLCGREFRAARLGDAHTAVLSHAWSAGNEPGTALGDAYARENGYADAAELRYCESAGREVDAEVDAAARAAGLPGGHTAASRALLAGLERVTAIEAGFDPSEETVASTNTVVWLRQGGVQVGRVEVMGSGKHLMIGVIEWRRPDWLAAEDVADHSLAVRRRLLAAAARVADERGASLAVMMPTGAADVGLSANGFEPAGEVWLRRCGSSVDAGS